MKPFSARFWFGVFRSRLSSLLRTPRSEEHAKARAKRKRGAPRKNDRPALCRGCYSAKPKRKTHRFEREELRVVCGTRGLPVTVAPFRAWRGSRDLVAQSPKFHASAVPRVRASAEKILTHSFAGRARDESATPPAFFVPPFPLRCFRASNT